MASYAYTFTSGDTVTPTKLNNARTVSDIVNADIKSDAAIAGSKLEDGAITNAKVSNSAAIAGTKIAPNFGSQNVVTSTTVAVEANGPANMIVSRASADASGPFLQLRKFRGTQASPAIVSSNDACGAVLFYGHDGTQVVPAAAISAFIDATPGVNDMPGRLAFGTTADGGSGTTERMRIDSSGNVGIGTSSPAVPLHVRGASVFGIINVSSTSANAEASIGFFDSSDTNSDKWVIGKNVAGVTSDAFCFYRDGNRVVITAAGNVGIGTTSPSVKLDVNGDVNTSSAYGVDGVQVVANRRTGWTAATGTATRTTFATSTVTTAQLAERVKALIDDLSSHGLIGT